MTPQTDWQRLDLVIRGHVERWEREHPFDRDAHIDPLLAFHIREARRHNDDDDVGDH